MLKRKKDLIKAGAAKGQGLKDEVKVKKTQKVTKILNTANMM